MSWAGFTPWSDEGVADPQPWCAWLRRNAPVHHLDRESLWVLSRYADVAAALRDHERFSSWEGNDRNFRHVDALPSLDPPEHTRVRRRMAAAFGRAPVTRWRAMVDESVSRAFAGMPGAGRTFDAVSTVTRAIPTDVLARMLDVAPRVLHSLADRPGSHRYAVLGKLVDRRARDLAAGERAPDADLVSMILAGEDGDVACHDAERRAVVAFVVLLLAAGVDTVSDFLAEVLLLAASRPEVADQLRRAAPAETVGDELLRWTSPLQATFRTTRCPVRLHGREVPSGAKVMLLLGSANRDTEWRPGADALHLATGEPAPGGTHLALGAGVHRCLGAALARAYAAAAVDALREVDLELAGEPVRRPTPAVRSLQLLPLRRIGDARASSG